MSTSSETSGWIDAGVVLRDLPVGTVVTADTSVDLRGGEWTRFGTSGVRGDRVTEATLRGLAEQSRAAARAQGFASGWAEGRREATAQTAGTRDDLERAFEEQSQQALVSQQFAVQTLLAAAARFEEVTRACEVELADRAVELGLQIAEAVLDRELAAVDDPAAEALRRALVAVPADVAVTVRLHPADLATLDEAGAAGEALRGRSVGYVADGTLSRGDAVVETETGVVDAGLSSALVRVREVLGR
jgi:flagellar assembly protein FliH